MKQTFNIPEGCNTVTVEQVGNQLITTFEPEKYVPKSGDCVKIITSLGETSFVICEKFDDKGLLPIFGNFIGKDNTVLFQNSAINFPYTPNHTFEKITLKQFQSEFEKLGYFYDFETNTASKKNFIPAKNMNYYSFGYEKAIQWDNDHGDIWRLKNNIVFKTESERDEALIKFNNK